MIAIPKSNTMGGLVMLLEFGGHGDNAFLNF